MGKELLPKIATEFIDNTLLVKRTGKEHLKDVSAHLFENSVITPFNHINLLDPLIIASELRYSFDDQITRLLLPASQKFFDGRMGKAAQIGMQHIAEKYEIELLPLIQHYDTEYSDQEKQSNYRNLFKTMIQALKEPGTIVALAPEGTRSKTGNLQEAQKGIDLLMRQSPQSMVFPIALSGMEKVMGQHYVFQSPNVTFCKPQLSTNILERSKQLRSTPHDLVMLTLGQELSQEQRGFYNEDSFPWFYDLEEMNKEKV